MSDHANLILPGLPGPTETVDCTAEVGEIAGQGIIARAARWQCACGQGHMSPPLADSLSLGAVGAHWIRVVVPLDAGVSVELPCSTCGRMMRVVKSQIVIHGTADNRHARRAETAPAKARIPRPRQRP